MKTGCMYSIGIGVEEHKRLWKEAQEADEPKHYYKVKMVNGGICYKYYKPSEAALLWKDEEWRLTRID